MGARDLVVAVDCSTTAAKAVVQDSDGRTVAQAARPLTTMSPRPGWHEQDAEQWWSSTRDAVAEAVAQVKDPTRVRALSVTHQRESFVCLDGDGRPLRPAILWLDGRAHAEIAELGTEQVHELSGKPPDTTPALYKLAWLGRHEPGVLRSARYVGDVHAYLAHQLTGRWSTSDASADTLGLLELRRAQWSPALLDIAGVVPSQLPELVPAGAPIGVLLEPVARALGLSPGVMLVAGIGDGQAAALALAATRSDTAYLNLGTSMVLGVQSESYRWDPAFRTLAGLRPGTYTLETVLNSAAYVATWCREEFGCDLPAAALEQEAAAVAPGAEGLLTLPYWNAAQTPYWDPLARGAVIGWHGQHTLAHLYRSVLEGVGFELRLHLGRLEAVTGQAIRSVRVVGGGARSPLWVQILADITQRPLDVRAEEEVSAIGAAVLGRSWLHRQRDVAGQGLHPGQPAGATLPGTIVHPDARLADRYAALADVHGRIYPQLRELFPAVAAAAARGC